MSEAPSHELQKRVGVLEQHRRVHEHRLGVLESMPDRVHELESNHRSLQSDHRAMREALTGVQRDLEQTVVRLSNLQHEQIKGFSSVSAAVRMATVLIPALITAAYTVVQWAGR